MTKLTKIILTNFRSFTSKKLEFSNDLVFLCGKNGIGKTNILEGLTLSGRSSYLRGSSFDDMVLDDQINNDKKIEFGVFCELENHEFIEKIGISFNSSSKKKIFQINGETLNTRRQNDAKSHLINFICLTPQLEQLFILGKSARRDYLDKIVCDIDFEHSTRLNNYQKLSKERLMILQKYQNQAPGEKWLDIIEEKIVELGIAIAFGRVEAVDFFNKAILSFSSKFPKSRLAIIGEVESMAKYKKAIEIEEFYKNKLKESRRLDFRNFKSNFGIHRSDFDAIFIDKNTSATRSSTGEQKAIMIGITLARAKISSDYKNLPTILIFDEILSHLDENRKINLVKEISKSKLQAFFSATSDKLIPSKILDLKKLEIINL